MLEYTRSPDLQVSGDSPGRGDLAANYLARTRDGVAWFRRCKRPDGALDFLVEDLNSALIGRLCLADAVGCRMVDLGSLAGLSMGALTKAYLASAEHALDDIEVFDECCGRWFSVTLLNVSPDHLIATFRDVTAYKVACAFPADLAHTLPLEASLARSEARLIEAQQCAQIGSWDKDLVSGELIWSPEMFEIYGVGPSSQGMTPESCLATVMPEDRGPTEIAFGTMLAEQSRMDFTHRVGLPGGLIKHVRVRGYATFSATGRPLRAAGTAQDVTQEVRRITALRDSEERLRSVFSAMSEGLVIHDRHGKALEANAAAGPILGLAHDELIGLTCLDPGWQMVRQDGSALPEDEIPVLVALRTGREQRQHLIGVMAKGLGLRWLSVNATLLWADGPESPSGAVASFVDVTDQRAVQARLQASVNELEDLYDNAPCGYHMLDANGLYLRINNTALAWLGCTREEVLGRLGPFDFLSACSKQTFLQNFPRFKAEGRIEGLELEFVGRGGMVRRCSLSASVISDGNGAFLATRSILHDITESHRVRTALSQLNADLSSMLENDVLAMVKVRGRHFEWVNRGAARILGYEPEEMLGRATRFLYGSEEDFDAVGQMLSELKVEGQHARMQVRMLRKDGGLVWIDLSCARLSPEHGELLGLFVDVTERKQAEDARIDMITVRERDAGRRELDRLKDQLLGNLSHELRTPLNAVMGFGQLLQSGVITPASPKYQDYVGQIISSGEHLLNLIDSMLDFAQARKGLIEFHPEPMALRPAIQGVIDMVQGQCDTRQLSIQLTLPGELEELGLDPVRFKQVLLSLLDNAIKYSLRGGVIDIRVSLEGDAVCRLEVEDRGIGIPEAYVPQLFQCFEQLSTGHTKKHEGAGVGLALVRQLVEAQGGSVGVRSELGVGSTFHVLLPIVGRC